MTRKSFLISVTGIFKRKKSEASEDSPLPSVPGSGGGKFKVPKLPGIPKKGFAINWESIYKKSFFYNSAGIIICAYFIAELFLTGVSPFFAPPPPPKLHKNAVMDKNDISKYELIYARNLFNEKGLIPDADDRHGGFDGPPVRSNLPINLLGVIVLTDELKSVASVEDKSLNQVFAVRVNEKISTDAVLQKIEHDRIIFLNNSTERREFIELPQDQLSLTTRKSGPTKSAGIISDGNGRYTIDRQELDKALDPTNLSKILTQARCVPNMQGGKSHGFRCFQIEEGSIYKNLGIDENDVILEIDGDPLTDPGVAFNKFSNLKSPNVKSITITKEANGKVSTSTFNIN